MADDVIYLDHAAATPLDRRVLHAMTPYFSDHFFNPSSPYAPALQVRREYDAAKQTIASAIGAKADELVMTAGATESINLAFSSVAQGGHVVTVAIEHTSILEAAKRHDHTIVASDERGRVSPQAIARALQPATRLVSVALANNELGTIQPLRDIAAVIETERARRRAAGEVTPLYLHSDASQGAGQLDIYVSRLGVDMMTLNAGKVYGPKQVGLLWAASHVRLQPHIVGGGQERGLRSGTENVPGVIGFARAMELAVAHRKHEAERLRALRDRLQQAIVSAHPDVVISGSVKHRLPGFLHVSFPGVDAERVLFALEMRGVLVATGSACAANKGRRSYVLTSIGLADDVADGSLRLSLGALSTTENCDRAAIIINEEVARERQRVA